MNYKIDQEGNIILMPTYHEVEAVETALCSKYLCLKQLQVSEKKCDEIISLRLSLNDALVESNKIKINLVTKPKEVAIKFFPKRGLWSRIVNFFDPPFTTGDFETADSLSGELVHLESMDYLPGKSLYPYNVGGALMYERQWLRCCWDAHGNCNCPQLGKKAGRYDLIRTGQHKISSVQCIAFAFIVTVIAAIFYSIIL